MNNNIFDGVKTIAIVGLSDNPERPSYDVASYLQTEGFRIIPINPNIREVLGEKAYPNLLSVPDDIKIDILDIFRRSDEVLPHVREAIKRGGIKTIWMQEGVENQQAYDEATACGINVIMNFCLMKTHRKNAIS